MLPFGMNNLTILLNFQIEHAMNESLPGNLNLLTSTDEKGKTFQKALFKKQDKVIRICTLFRELDIILYLLNFFFLFRAASVAYGSSQA